MKQRKKTVMVECKFKDTAVVKEFTIDPTIFDDVCLEAATQFVEDCVSNNKDKLTPILTVYEKKDSKNYNKHICYNSYFMMINAGCHKKAEILRHNFMKATKIDLKLESIRGTDGTTNSK